MTVIYVPKGKAREYSPLAANLYSGCDHNCDFCFVPGMMSRFRKNYNHTDVKPRPNILRDLERDARKHAGSKDPVLLCFTCDPYCTANDEHKITRQALEIFLDHRIPVSIYSLTTEYLFRF
jgi:DNA repair photolyase